MSEYLLNKLFQKCDNIISTNLKDVTYNTEITLNCNIHGQYVKTVNQILYKNPNCPECTRIAKNKKLSNIGKTKTGEKNNFYRHKHSDETCAKIRNTLKINAEERNKKISETVKSKECQERTKRTCLEKYGVTHPSKSDIVKEKRKSTFYEKYNGIGNGSPIIQSRIKNTYKEKYGVENVWSIDSVKNKSKQTKFEKYGDINYNNREKAKQTCLNLYGIDIPNKFGSKEYFENMYKIYGENWLSIVGKKSNESNHQRISKFEKENNCTNEVKLIKKYGQGWLSIKNTLCIIKNKNNVYILNNEIQKIIQYNENALKTYISNKEKEIVTFIKSFYNEPIIENDRQVIKPKELDIYLPNLNLAIEFNGSYWHSIEIGTPKNYHLEKSLLCKEKNIRLIHIYEFEDFEKQKQLLKDLILGQDNYPKNDFNKNNLLDNIPEPEIIYKENNLTIYGAGKLYN